MGFSHLGVGQLLIPHYGGNAFNWYVDSVAGNDANTGKSAGQAFATLGAVEAVAVAGNKIGLKRGSNWRDELNLSTLANITIDTYGVTGRLPIVDGANILVNATLVQDGVQTNCYKATWTPTAATKVAPSVWIDGVRLARAASAAACNAAPGSYYSSSTYTSGVGQDVYIHPTGSTDPATDGKLYEMSVREYCVNLGANAIVKNVHTKRQCSDDGNLTVGRSAYISGCVVEDGTKHNLLIASGTVEDTWSYLLDSWYSVFGGTTSSPMQGYHVGYTDNITWRRCIVLNDNTHYDDLGDYLISAFNAHGNNVGNEFGTITYEDCQAYYVSGPAFNADDCGAIVIDTCLGYEALGIATATEAGMVITCTDSELYRTKTGVASLYARVFQTAVACTINISRLRCVIPNSFVVLHQGNGNITLSITDSILALRSATSSAMIDLALVGGTGAVNLTGLRNVIDGWGAVFSNRDYRVGSGATLTLNSDYNVFQNAGDNFDLGGTVYSTVALYKAAYPTQDTHSQTGTPGFVEDPVTNRNYSYSPGALAVTVGAGQVAAFQWTGNYAALVAQVQAM